MGGQHKYGGWAGDAMRRVVVVNDCAHVIEDMLPFLRRRFDVELIERTRGLYSKTLGILFDVARSRGDIYHANYALQDAYLVSVLRHLDILHVHGSDVRWTMKDPRWGWIVRHDLRAARRVIYATPDLEDAVRRYRPDATYLPNPVRLDRFTRKREYGSPPRAVYFRLRYEELPPELPATFRRNGIELDVLERNVPYSMMPEVIRKYDIFVDRFTIRSCSKTCLEAMASGLATIDYRHGGRPAERVEELADPSRVREEGERNRELVEREHDAEKVAEKLGDLWEELL